MPQSDLISSFVRDLENCLEEYMGEKKTVYDEFVAVRNADEELNADLVWEVAACIEEDWLLLSDECGRDDILPSSLGLSSYNRFIKEFEREFPGVKIPAARVWENGAKFHWNVVGNKSGLK